MRRQRHQLLTGLAGMLMASLLMPSAARAAAEPVFVPTGSSAIRDGVLHHHGDPRQGTIRIRTSLQWEVSEDNTARVRAAATVTGVSKVVRVQIDRVRLWTDWFVGGTAAKARVERINSTPANSGSGSSVSSSSPFVDIPSGSQQTHPRRVAEVFYSTRWADGTVTRGVFSSLASEAFAPDTVGNPVRDPRTVDAAGSVVLAHFADPARGTVKVDAGLRLYRAAGLEPGYQINRIQPFATITKGNGALRVQIDALEGLRFYDFPGSPTHDDPVVTQNPTAWPSNVAGRSSGTGNSVTLSTAISPVVAERIGRLAYFSVIVFFSVRWTDGTLTRGLLVTPLSTLGHVVPRDGPS